MSDEHRPDEQTPDEQVTDQPLPGAQDEEPTQPLTGWRPTEPAPAPAVQPEGRVYGARDDADHEPPAEMLEGPPPHATPFGEPQAPQQQQPQPDAGHDPAAPTVPYPTQGPYPQQPGQQPGQPWFGPGPQPRPTYAGPTTVSRKIPLWVWPAVACLALVVGMLGGLAGGAIQDELASRPGTNDNGLDGVRTQTAAPLEADNGSVAAVAQALLPSTVQIVAELRRPGRAAPPAPASCSTARATS